MLFYNNESYLTGGRDGIIKLWNIGKQIDKNTSNHSLVANLEGHTDWINEMSLNKSNNHLFSCSNDTTVLVWDMNKLKPRDDGESLVDGKFRVLLPKASICELATDYITCLEYNEYSNSLITGSLDSKICIYEIDRDFKFNFSIGEKNIFKQVEEEKSIYSITANRYGSIVACSAYENVSFMKLT